MPVLPAANSSRISAISTTGMGKLFTLSGISSRVYLPFVALR